MLEKIRALAMEKLASEAEVDAFMEGFGEELVKQAAVDWQSPAIRAGFGLAGSLVGAGIVSGLAHRARNVDTTQLRGKFDMALAQVMSTNKIIKGARPEKVREFAETFFRFAPHVASDPNLLGSILSNAILGESIDPQTIKTLVDLEGRYTDNNRIGPLPGIKT